MKHTMRSEEGQQRRERGGFVKDLGLMVLRLCSAQKCYEVASSALGDIRGHQERLLPPEKSPSTSYYLVSWSLQISHHRIHHSLGVLLSSPVTSVSYSRHHHQTGQVPITLFEGREAKSTNGDLELGRLFKVSDSISICMFWLRVSGNVEVDAVKSQSVSPYISSDRRLDLCRFALCHLPLHMVSQPPVFIAPWSDSFLRRGLHYVRPIPHLFGNFVPSVVHVCEGLLVLSVLRAEAHLCHRQASNGEETADAEDDTCLHCWC